ncbi:unnamed protein product [Rotaria magnacalcarata]
MASGDNPRLPLTSGTSPIVKYTEMRNPTETPSTTITMASMPSPPPFSSSTSSHEPKANSSFAANTYELRRVTIRQRHAMKKALMGNVGYRLVKRKELHIQRRLIGDIMCIFGIFGIILMIIENELTFNRVDHKDTTSSLLIKATITFTTILLVCLVFYYHRINLSLHCVDNSIDDWRIALTRTKILSILFEAFICMIHPIPGHFLIEWSSQYVKTIGTNFNHIYPYRAVPNSLTTPTSLNTTTVSTTTTTATTTMTLKDAKENPLAYVPIDIMLSIPMFFRLYLVCRLIMLRSHLVRDVSSQSLGYLNRVSFNFPFIIKSYMQRRPTILLTSFCITTFFIASWAMRACDYNVNTGHMSMLDATWLFIISFTTIGYGDIVPSTYCGRAEYFISRFSTSIICSANNYQPVDDPLLPNDELASLSVYRQLFKPSGRRPTFSSAKLTKYLITCLTINGCILCAIQIFAGHHIANKNPTAIIVLIIFLITEILFIIAIAAQPKNQKSIYFQTPCVPYVPILSILINTYLILKLSPATWIRFGVWMFLGFLIYGFYGFWHSSQRFINDTQRLLSGSTSSFNDS